MVTVLPPLRFRPFLVCRTPELEMVRLLPNVTASSVAVVPLTVSAADPLRVPSVTVPARLSALNPVVPTSQLNLVLVSAPVRLALPPVWVIVPILVVVKLPPKLSVPPERVIVLPALFQVAVLLPPRLKVPLETLTAAPAVLVKLPYV